MAKTLTYSSLENILKSKRPLTLRLNGYTQAARKETEQVLGLVLKYLNLEKLSKQFSLCLHQLSSQTQELNLKRLYFSEHDISITDPDQYKSGTKALLEENEATRNSYVLRQKEKDLYLKIQFQTDGNNFSIQLKSNCLLTGDETDFLKATVEKSAQYDSVRTVLKEMPDGPLDLETGFTIMLLALKNTGLGNYSYTLESQGQESVVTISWPLDQIQKDDIDKLSRIIVQDIESLPPFPENLLALQKLIGQQDITFTRIAEQVSIDPYLTADILKIVNSGAFMLSYRIESIAEAIKFLGLNELKHLIITLGAQNILKKHDHNSEEMWRHSYKTAFYALQMAKALRLSPQKQDSMFSCAILHDIGKVPYSTLFPELIEKLKIYCACNSVSNDVFEEIIGGINHNEIGFHMAKKWHFPEVFSMVIRHHHNPERAPQFFQDIAGIVNLADSLVNIEDGYLSPNQIDPFSLKFYNFSSADNFLKSFETLKQSFEDQNIMP